MKNNMERTKNMQSVLDEMTKAVYGRSNSEAKEKNICVTCGSPKMNPNDFNDNLSRKEASISQMCQNCQDNTFCCGPDGCK